MDYNYIQCGECDFFAESTLEMIRHLFNNHPQYNKEEAEEYTRTWGNQALEEIELENLIRGKHFQQTGYDMERG